MADTFEMWGPAASGPRLVDFDRIKAAEQLGEIAMQPYKAESLAANAAVNRAHADLYGAQAQAKRREAVQEAQLAQLIAQSQGQVSQGMDMADQLDSWAELATGAGMVTKAGEFAKQAAHLRLQAARTANAATNAELHQLKAAGERSERIANLLAGVNSPEGWAAANQLYSMQYGEASPFAAVPFPGQAGVEQIRLGAIATRDQIAQQMTAARDRETRRHHLEQEANSRARTGIAGARLRISAAREERLAKTGGGKAIQRPSREEVAQAERLIEGDESLDLGGAYDRATRGEAAFSIASDAKARMQKNPALDADTALRQAFLAAKAGGQFEVEKGLFGFNNKTKFVKGKVPEILPAPANPKDLKIGTTYRSPTGMIGKWTGKGFEPINPARLEGIGAPLSGGNGAADDDEEDDE